MAMIDVIRAANIWGPGRKCVLCRAMYALMPGRTEVPDDVARDAVAAGVATRIDPIMGDPDHIGDAVKPKRKRKS